jgi:hypothetical protein
VKPSIQAGFKPSFKRHHRNPLRIESPRVKTATSRDTLKNDGTFGGTFQNVIKET